MIKIKAFLVLVGVVLFANSCFVFDRLDNTNLVPYLYTTPVINITGTTATCGGIMDTTVSIKSRNASITSRGLCWSSSTTSPSIDDSKVMCGSGNSPFTGQLTGLSANTLYYVRAFAESSEGVGYGNPLQFNTTTIGKIETIVPLDEDRGETWAICGGNVLNDSNAAVITRGVCWGLTINPTIANSKTVDGSGLGPFKSTITGLKVGTSYSVRAYATSSLGTMYGKNIPVMTYTPPGNCTDIQGNVYKTIRVGAQVWMAENLRETKTQSYDNIPLATDNSAWALLGPHYCDNGNYGKLYNWQAVTTVIVKGGGWQRGIAPNGWRMPTDEDWQILEDYLTKKSVSLSSTGFNPLLGGYRSENGDRAGEGNYAGWWSVSPADSLSVASSRYIENDLSQLLKTKAPKNKGLGVRFIRTN